MAIKKQVNYCTNRYRQPEVINTELNDMLYYGANMLFPSPTLKYSNAGIGVLYSKNKMIFKTRKHTIKAMQVAMRNFIMSQLTEDQADIVLDNCSGDASKFNYYDFFHNIGERDEY